MDIPSHYKSAFSESEIQSAVTRLAADITPWARSVFERTGQSPLAVCVLRGAVHFFSDLLRHIDCSVEPAFGRTWRYLSSDNAVQRKSFSCSLEHIEPKGRVVLLVDDICDTGSTLSELSQIFRDSGAVEVKSAVLILRKLGTVAFAPTWYAFEFSGADWFVGYGMEDKDSFSNLPAIYRIKI